MTTDKKLVAASQEAVIKAAWEQWRTDPTTNQMIKILRECRERYVRKAVEGSANVAIPSDTIRFFMVGVKNYDFIIDAFTNYEVFLTLLNHKEE